MRRRSLFRINRDVRFSDDKRPYKTNAGAVLSRDGTRHGRGIVYLQLGGPQEPFVAAGFHMPEPADLAALRGAIAEAPEQWLAIAAALLDAGLPLSPEPSLQRTPKGFEALAGSPVAGVLRLKRLVVVRPLARERLFSGEVVVDVVAFATAALPLLRFGWAAPGGGGDQGALARLRRGTKRSSASAIPRGRPGLAHGQGG